MGRRVTVSVWDLTDAEIDQLAADRETREPDHAAELRRFKEWRRTHPDPRPRHLHGREYPVDTRRVH